MEANVRNKPLLWVASSRRDLAAFPKEARRECGFALRQIQQGDVPDSAKPLKGFGGGVLEIVAGDEGGTFRAFYTVRFARVTIVLDAFQKKSKRGIATPKQDIDRIKRRLAAAKSVYEEWCREQEDAENQKRNRA